MSKPKFDFEENMRRLDEIIAAIEDADGTLDASLALYKEGIALAADCAAKLNETEREVVMLTNSFGPGGATIVQQPFASTEDDDE